MNDDLPILYDANFPDATWIYLKYKKNVHGLIAGSTGSGKSLCALSVCGRISLYLPDSKLYICDYKNADEFHFLDGTPRYFQYHAYAQGIEQVHNIMVSRIEGCPERAPVFLLLDEFPAFVNSILTRDKKAGQAVLEKFQEIMFMGRSMGIHVIAVAQRPDASVFSGGTRDQFTFCVGLGRLSEEANKMLFGDERHNIPKDFVTGEGRGFLLQQGDRIRPVIVPRINKMDKLEKAIFDGVTR